MERCAFGHPFDDAGRSMTRRTVGQSDVVDAAPAKEPSQGQERITKRNLALSQRALETRRQRLAAVPFEQLLSRVQETKRVAVAEHVREVLLALPFVREKCNSLPSPAAVAKELAALQRHVLSALEMMRHLRTAVFLENTFQRLDAERLAYERLKRPGRRRSVDQGLQRVAVELDHYLAGVLGRATDDEVRRGIVLRLLERAGEPVPDWGRRDRVEKFFTVEMVL